MGRRAERRAAQEAELAAQVRMSHERPNEPPDQVPADAQCPGALGQRCDFTMRGIDGRMRCWTCARRKPA